MATIILTGGGTAGHCTPNLALLPHLKNYFNKIYYIGSENGIEKNIVSKTDIPYYSISCAKLNRSFNAKNLTIPFKVIKGIIQAEKILKETKADVIFSKGGFVAVPTVIAAHKLNIPIISHESDYTVGLANKITAKYAKKVLTSFSDTAKTLKNGEHVGSPIRNELFNTDKSTALKLFGFTGNKPILLVTGGSLGAKALNDVLRISLPNLLPKYDIIHLCGKGNLIKEKTPLGYYQTEFLSNIEQAYSVADICISRAGSNTLFELLAIKMPCVLIPLPKGASRGDQILNAEYFQKKGLVSVLPQNVLTDKSLVTAINATYANRFNLKANLNTQDNLIANEKIVKIIYDQIKL